MTQLSLFSADLTPPGLSDLAGLLAAHGQITAGAGGARLSILVAERWRADVLVREFRVRDVPVSVEPGGEAQGLLVRSDRTPVLQELAGDWSRGAVKAVPNGLQLDPGLLRCWAVAAGRCDEPGYLLGLDPRAPDTYEPLAGALARTGLAGALLGVRAGRPGLRIAGHRRLLRLFEMVGTAPIEAPPDSFPPAPY